MTLRMLLKQTACQESWWGRRKNVNTFYGNDLWSAI